MINCEVGDADSAGLGLGELGHGYRDSDVSYGASQRLRRQPLLGSLPSQVWTIETDLSRSMDLSLPSSLGNKPRPCLKATGQWMR